MVPSGGARNTRKLVSVTPNVPINNKTAIVFTGDVNESLIEPIPMSKVQFLDIYSRGNHNLSTVPRPVCFQGDEWLLAPESYWEHDRKKIAKQYSNLPHWQHKQIFKKIVGKLRKQFNVVGVTISIVTQNKALIKIESILGVNEIPRPFSIDGHAMLSRDYFKILDASTDWRTKMNPFVTGVPYIKFYCGVPLLTDNNQIVGILALHDAFKKSEFGVENCQLLKNYSKEIMTLLDTPIDDLLRLDKKVDNKFIDNEINELTLKLGRATSTTSLLMTVFEKDGSGGRYTQNHNFRFSEQLEQHSFGELNNKKIWQKLAKMKSIKNAGMVLTRAFARYYQFDFVYILDFRINESCQIESKHFPIQEHAIEIENNQFTNKIIKKTTKHDSFITKIIGIHGNKFDSIQFDNALHIQALQSDYGISYKSLKAVSLYNRGVIIPFHKHESKLIRQTKDQLPILDIALRSGGYLIGMFNETRDNFTPQHIENAYKDVMTFRKIYISQF